MCFGRARVVAGQRQVYVASVASSSAQVQDLGNLLFRDKRSDVGFGPPHGSVDRGHASSKVLDRITGLDRDQS
jgi:hypothetical protein